MDTPPVNGHAPRLTRLDLREAHVAAAVERERQKAYTQRRLLEQFTRWDDFWSCADLWRETQTSGLDVPPSQPGDRKLGEEWPIWRTIDQVNRLRQKARIVCATNPYARGLLTNLINHIVGKGFQYKFLSKENTADSDPDKAGRVEAVKQLIAKAQDEWDRVQRRNRWSGMVGPRTPLGPTREQEILRRILRDGEAFLHCRLNEGRLGLVFIEPERVRDAPANATPAEGWNLGIQCDLEDPEQAYAYHVVWTDPIVRSLDDKSTPWGEVIDAEEIEHFKGPDTDSTIRRGISAFAFGVAAALERARVLGRNVSIGASGKAAITETWKHAHGTESEVSTFRSGVADHTEDYVKGDGTTGTRNVDARYPGMVRDIPEGMEPVFPAPDNSAIYLEVLQADLRAACAAFCAPEYFTADASNGTYAGLKEASAPFVKYAEAYQVYLAAAFARVAWRVIELAVNEGRLPREALTMLDLQVEGPTVYQRDRLQVAQEAQIYNLLGVWSPQTIAMETGKDYEVEAANIEQHRERFGDLGTPLGMPGADGQMPGMTPLTPGLGDDAGGALHESVLEAAGTCKPGETAKATGCVPASGDAKADKGGGEKANKKGEADPEKALADAKSALDTSRERAQDAYAKHKENPTPENKKAMEDAVAKVKTQKAEVEKAEEAAKQAKEKAQKAVTASVTDPVTDSLPDSYQRGTLKAVPEELDMHADTWQRKLTGKETQAVEEYTGSYYSVINKSARKCPETLDCLDSKSKAILDNLHSAIDKSGPLPMPVNAYRGIDLPPQQAEELFTLAKSLAGKEKAMAFPGIQSLSLNPEVSSFFAGNGKRGLMFEIRAKSGAYVEKLSSTGNEQELLHKHNAKYRVRGVKESVDYGHSKYRVIQLEEV